MKFLIKTILYTYLSCIAYIATAQSIAINDSKSAQELIENVLIKSNCLVITNPVARGDTFTTGKASYGSFSNQGGSFPFSEGVVLSTWSAKHSENGPSAQDKAMNGDSRWSGDADLESALGIIAPYFTKNATVLEFDFIAKTDFISFNYIFASNEYRDYFPCEFSDGFAFLIKEKASSGPYKNIAVIPNSTIPVASTNVHPVVPPYNQLGVIRAGCPASNENYFEGYNNNLSPINYYGQTKVLNAQSAVISGITYHIKLVIADYRNEQYDSAVFLEAGSFAPKINLGPDQTLCFNEKTILDTGLSNSAYSYEWFKDGGGTSIGSTSTLEVDSPGTYSVNISLAAGCIAVGKVKISYKNPILKTLTQCGDSSGTALFDLTQMTSSVNISSNNSIKYYSDLSGTEITNPTTYKSTTNTVYASITSATAECLDFVELKLNVLTISNAVQTVTFCDNDAIDDGTRVFHLTNEISPKITPAVAAPYLVEGYYSFLDDAVNKENKLNNNYTNIPNQNIFARVENGIDCYSIYEIELNVTAYNTTSPNIINEVIINDFSGNNSVEIKTIGTGPFEYSLDGITFQDESLFTNVRPGDYIVYVRDNTSCGISTTKVYVLDYPRFFTPNADGYNDLWKIKNLDLYPMALITIFDRYGKLLKQLNATSSGWNGSYNGIPLPADDYWFHIKLADSKTIKGHFSLKR